MSPRNGDTVREGTPRHRRAADAPGFDVRDTFLRNLLENGEEVIYVKDVESRFIGVSAACARLHGRDPEEMIGLSDFDLFPDAHALRTFEDEQRIIATGVPVLHQTEHERWHDRPDSWVSSSKFPLLGPDGTVIGIYGISRDVTELVLAEREMARLADATERANAELRRVEAELRAVLDASTDEIAKYDAALRYQYVNPAGERSRGLGLDELIGRTDRETGMAEEALELWEDALRHVLRTGRPGALEFSVPAHREHGEARTADDGDAGERSWFHTTITPDLGPDGAVLGVLTSTRDITATKRAELALAHQASHDSVTGLANRYRIIERLGHAVARLDAPHRRLALCFVDVDHFKEVNDTYGHDAGDRVLVELADRLRDVAGPGDVVGRLGGDEFVVLREDVGDEEDVRLLADAVVRSLAEPIVDGERQLRVSASVGVVLADDPRTTPSELLRDADAAMYGAKESGRNRYHVSGDAHDTGLSTATLEAELRLALDEEQFALVFQPLLALGDQSVLGLEALLRWDHPERGRLMPADFLAFADRRGLMTPIGEWVLRTGCSHLAEWSREAVEDAAPLVLAVNVTARQLRADGFAATVASVLATHALEPAQLRLEVPERALLNEGLELSEVLAELAGMGVQLAVDDFGASVASLARLPHLPVSVVKLERFADLPGGQDLVSAVIDVAHGLGMSVVGGGIESTGQLRDLNALACDDGQGFLLGRPLDLEETERLLAADRAARRARAYARRLSVR